MHMNSIVNSILTWALAALVVFIAGATLGAWRRGIGAREVELELKNDLDMERRKRIPPERAEVDVTRRVNDEYFHLIERVIKQREEWRDMFMEHSSQHLQAQLTLETEIKKQRIWLKQAILIVNDYRKKENQPMLQAPGQLDALVPPIGVASAFEHMLEEMKANAPKQIDAIAERELLASSLAALPPPGAMPNDM